MKPKITKRTLGLYWTFICRGIRPDGVDAIGFGHTLEQAYNGWLAFDETECPF